MNVLIWVLIILLLLGAFGSVPVSPVWRGAPGYGWGLPGGLGLIVIILLVLVITGRL